MIPTSDNLAALMALFVADLSESQRETLTNLIFQRGVALTALAVDQLRAFLITLVRAPVSSLEHPSWTRKTGPRWFIATSDGELDKYEGHRARMRTPARKASLMSMRTFFGSTTRINAIGFASPSKAGS